MSGAKPTLPAETAGTEITRFNALRHGVRLAYAFGGVTIGAIILIAPIAAPNGCATACCRATRCCPARARTNTGCGIVT